MGLYTSPEAAEGRTSLDAMQDEIFGGQRSPGPTETLGRLRLGTPSYGPTEAAHLPIPLDILATAEDFARGGPLVGATTPGAILSALRGGSTEAVASTGLPIEAPPSAPPGGDLDTLPGSPMGPVERPGGLVEARAPGEDPSAILDALRGGSAAAGAGSPVAPTVSGAPAALAPMRAPETTPASAAALYPAPGQSPIEMTIPAVSAPAREGRIAEAAPGAPPASSAPAPLAARVAEPEIEWVEEFYGPESIPRLVPRLNPSSLILEWLRSLEGRGGMPGVQGTGPNMSGPRTRGGISVDVPGADIWGT
jgi:hypothetical protein